MADLNDISSSETVRLAGAGPLTGIPSNWMQVDVNGSAQVGIYNASGTSIDFNYGTVGAASIRVAAQIGNATGSAAFGAGTTTAQVIRVVLPTDQTAIPVTQSGTWNITNITGTISLPTGAATSANQTTEITSLQLIDNPVGSVGAGTAGTSSFLAGGVFNTALPSLSNGQQAALQLDTSGRLITVATVTFPYDQNYGTVGATTLRTASQIGNATGAATFGAGATSAQTLRVAANTYDGSGNAITSSTNGTSGNQSLHVGTPDTPTASTALGALSAAVSVALAGQSSVGLQLAAGTLIGTLVVECSLDGGATYPGIGTFYDPSNSTTATSIVFSAANGAKTVSILAIGGSSHVRVRVSAYTSGTANAILRASQIQAAAGAVTAAAFGTVTNSYITLTANTTTMLLAANSNRKYAYISNNSGGLIAIQFGSATGLTSAARGLVIPNGSFYELKGDNLYTGAVYAYTNASGLVIAVTEGTP
jgi:hypothetical protein